MKSPESIGQRAFNVLTKYIIASGHDIKNWCRDRGINKSILYTWAKGNNPNSKYLAMMCDLGFDVTYILTGKTRADHNSSMVPVVRCKDCKYRDTAECPMDSQNPWYDTPDNGFCSYGERKEELPFGSYESLGIKEGCIGLVYNDIFDSYVDEAFKQELMNAESKMTDGSIQVTSAFSMTNEEVKALSDSVKP